MFCVEQMQDITQVTTKYFAHSRLKIRGNNTSSRFTEFCGSIVGDDREFCIIINKYGVFQDIVKLKNLEINRDLNNSYIWAFFELR